MTTLGTSMVVAAGPFFSGPLKANSQAFVQSMKQSYTKVRVFDRQEQRVDDRRALATSGRAVNDKKVKIRFVSVVVKAKPRNFAINAFVGYDTNPASVLPTLTAILNGFTVLDQGGGRRRPVSPRHRAPVQGTPRSRGGHRRVAAGPLGAGDGVGHAHQPDSRRHRRRPCQPPTSTTASSRSSRTGPCSHRHHALAARTSRSGPTTGRPAGPPTGTTSPRTRTTASPPPEPSRIHTVTRRLGGSANEQLADLTATQLDLVSSDAPSREEMARRLPDDYVDLDEMLTRYGTMYATARWGKGVAWSSRWVTGGFPTTASARGEFLDVPFTY